MQLYQDISEVHRNSVEDKVKGLRASNKQHLDNIDYLKEKAQFYEDKLAELIVLDESSEYQELLAKR